MPETPTSIKTLRKIILAAGEAASDLYWYVQMYNPQGFADGRTTRPWLFPKGLWPVLPVIPEGYAGQKLTPGLCHQCIGITQAHIEVLCHVALSRSSQQGVTFQPALADKTQLAGMPIYNYNHNLWIDAVCPDCGLCARQDLRWPQSVCEAQFCPVSRSTLAILYNNDNNLDNTLTGCIPD